MKKILLILACGLTLSTNVVLAADNGARRGASSRIVAAAAAHPKTVQAGASAIAAHPAAQARMDAAMTANPAANKLMLQVQKAGGYKPASD